MDGDDTRVDLEGDRGHDAAIPGVEGNQRGVRYGQQAIPNVHDWIQVLDDLEANLALAAQQLDAGAGRSPAQLKPLVPPRGQMPDELLRRAGDLLERSVELESAITRTIEDHAQKPQVVRWPRHRARRGRVDLGR